MKNVLLLIIAIAMSCGQVFSQVEIDNAVILTGNDTTTRAVRGLVLPVNGTDAANKDYVDSRGFSHYIGELYGGGIVVSVWKEAGVEHGLIASLVDISQGYIQWSNIDYEVGGLTAKNKSCGEINTSEIINQPGNTIGAAKLCDDYTNDGFSDWYLPAMWELVACYNSAHIINKILGDTDGFQNTYWSSTEANAPNAYYLDFNYGNLLADFKAHSYKLVRAVRKF